MYTIIRQDVPALQRKKRNPRKKETYEHEIEIKRNIKIRRKIENQAGFTLAEVLVSLCIVCLIIGVMWQWGIVMQQTSVVMAENQQALWLADQVYAGFMVQCPEGWQVAVTSESTGGILYEATVKISTSNRNWTFYYVGPEKIVVPVGDTYVS